MKSDGRCVLFSSHIMQEIAALCDRVVVIANGKSVFEGTVDELKSESESNLLEDAFVNLIAANQPTGVER